MNYELNSFYHKNTEDAKEDMNTKLLYPFANVMGIFFPVGKLKDGGTCQFATEKCLKECISFRNIFPKENPSIPFELKNKTYIFFKKNSVDIIVKKLIEELYENKCNIISWFASGDCPTVLTKKIYDIIHKLKKYNIIQSGFTRNFELFKKIYFYKYESLKNSFQFRKKLRVLFTMENKKAVEKYNWAIADGDDSSGFIYAVPNYETGKSEIYAFKAGKMMYDECGYSAGWGDPEIVKKGDTAMDCNKCWKNKKGCFISI